MDKGVTGGEQIAYHWNFGRKYDSLPDEMWKTSLVEKEFPVIITKTIWSTYVIYSNFGIFFKTNFYIFYSINCHQSIYVLIDRFQLFNLSYIMRNLIDNTNLHIWRGSYGRYIMITLIMRKGNCVSIYKLCLVYWNIKCKCPWMHCPLADTQAFLRN